MMDEKNMIVVVDEWRTIEVALRQAALTIAVCETAAGVAKALGNSLSEAAKQQEHYSVVAFPRERRTAQWKQEQRGRGRK